MSNPFVWVMRYPFLVAMMEVYALWVAGKYGLFRLGSKHGEANGDDEENC